MGPLRKVFSQIDCPGLLVGLDDADDAAVYKISDQKAIILTTDFLTPVVDDPFMYGAIAAANSMSDVFAMGGEVLLTLNVAGFPEDLPESIIMEIFRGGAEKTKEAGGIIAGGHTIDTKEPFYGMAVCGVVHPDKLLTISSLQAGDLLVLTKPLGTGIITTAFKGDQCDPKHLDAAVVSMAELNNRSSQAAIKANCKAATDITGFSLLGHACEMSISSNIALELSLKNIPFLPGAEKYAEQWLFPGGTARNEKAFSNYISFDQSVAPEIQRLLFTAETSGGLLIAVPQHAIENFERYCREVGQAGFRIGTVVPGEPGVFVDV